MASAADYTTSPIVESDYEQWRALFGAYIDFYKASLPETQYRATFARLLDPSKDLYGIALRSASDSSKLYGIAHFYPHQTPWSEKMVMHLNDLFVDPSVRGRQLGRKLMLAVAERAQHDGCYRMQWTTQYGNPARKLYDQVGESLFVQYRRVLTLPDEAG